MIYHNVLDAHKQIATKALRPSDQKSQIALARQGAHRQRRRTVPTTPTDETDHLAYRDAIIAATTRHLLPAIYLD